jgi:hypothetical protein
MFGKGIKKILVVIVSAFALVIGFIVRLTIRIIKKHTCSFVAVLILVVISDTGSILGTPYTFITSIIAWGFIVSIYAVGILISKQTQMWIAFVPYCAGWFTLISLFARIYRELGLIKNGEVVYDNGTCYYFSLVTWTTLGYGDIKPTDSARFFATAEAFFGYVFISLFVSLVILNATRQRKPKKKFPSKHKKKNPFHRPSIGHY